MFIIPTALPVSVVAIDPPSLTVSPGQSPTLTCIVTVEENLVVIPSVEWTNSSRQEVGGVSVTTTIDNTVITSNLTFTGLLTSQAGPYICRARISVPSVNIVDRDNTDRIDVIAQSKFVLVAMDTHVTLCINVIIKVNS